MNLKIILGSTRQGMQGKNVACWVYGEALKQKDLNVELLELSDWPLPFFNEIAPPDELEGKYSVDIAKKWADKIGEADAFIIVTPEYNHGYPAVLKNALDYVYNEWNNKPVAFVSYSTGQYGGVRAVEQLRQVVAALKMVQLTPTVSIPRIKEVFDEKGNVLNERYTKSLSKVLEELKKWVNLLSN